MASLTAPPAAATGRETVVVVSLDTEEDNWAPAREGVTVENIRELPRLQAFCDRLGIRPTYFTTWQVATVPWAAEIIGDLADAGAEIGAHLHPWNTPPMDEAFVPRLTMTANLPAALQRAKLERLTAALTAAAGAAPRSFRAGRFGLGRETAVALAACGYEVDSSVTPWIDWSEYDDGPSHVGAPVQAYRLSPGADVRTPSAAGTMLEVPLSCAYTRRPFGFWHRVHSLLDRPALRPLRLVGVASRLGLMRKIMLSPENDSPRDMLALARVLVAEGTGFVQLYLHSPTLRAGLSPYAPAQADVERMYAAIEEFVTTLGAEAPIRFATVREAAQLLEARGALLPAGAAA